MNSLTLGFFYVVGLSWLFIEASLMAGNGSWGPFWLFIGGFAIMFSILGCLPLSDTAVNKFGSIFAVIIGFALLLISIFGWLADGGVLLGVVKTSLAVVFVIFGILSCSEGDNTAKESH